jgi:hypothetical protein
MARRLMLLAILASTVWADPRQEVYDLLGTMASGLSEGNAQQFLDAFDRSMKGYSELAANVRALVVQGDVMSTIEFIDDAGDGQRHTMRVDWLLQLADKDHSALVVRRENTIEFRVEKQKKKWRIVSLAPLDFFAPPQVGR